MGLFSKQRFAKQRRQTQNNKIITDDHYDQTNGHGHRQKRSSRPMFDRQSGQFNRRPSFGQWLKMTWLDILTMVIMGAIGLGVYEAHPAPSRSFPVTFPSGDIVYPQFAYPLRKEIVPIWLAALLGSLIPIFVILCMQIRIRSFWDVNNAIIGLLYSLITAAVFQVFLKWLIGGLRPHFLSVCDPDPALVEAGGNGFRNVMFQRNICRGNIDQIDDSLESFPSGHSTAAWAGFLYLYYYLNAKLKVFSNYHPAMWKIIVLYAPLLGATLITGSLTIDEFHNWYDCLAGAIIGAVMATSAYRMVYASVWDFRFNHIPLTRHTPFSFGAGQAGAGGFESAVFTRRAGWGYDEAYGGAPFDAAHHLRGQMNGFNTGATMHDSKLGHGLGHGHKRNDNDFNNTNTTLHENGHGHHGHKKHDIEHNAGGGYFPNTTTQNTSLGHHSTALGHNTGVGHNSTALGHNTGLVHDSDITGRNTGLGHNNNNNNNNNTLGHSTGLGHNNNTLGHNSGLGHNSNTLGHNSGLGHNSNTFGHNTGTGYAQEMTTRGDALPSIHDVNYPSDQRSGDRINRKAVPGVRHSNPIYST